MLMRGFRVPGRIRGAWRRTRDSCQQTSYKRLRRAGVHQNPQRRLSIGAGASTWLRSQSFAGGPFELRCEGTLCGDEVHKWHTDGGNTSRTRRRSSRRVPGGPTGAGGWPARAARRCRRALPATASSHPSRTRPAPTSRSARRIEAGHVPRQCRIRGSMGVVPPSPRISSRTRAAESKSASPRGLPTICRPTGKWCSRVKPQGRERAGQEVTVMA